MTCMTKTRLLLLCGLVLSATMATVHNEATHFAPASLHAQETGSQQPPVRRQRPAPVDAEDQDKPQGQTSISVS
jgi:hypothetical protein